MSGLTWRVMAWFGRSLHALTGGTECATAMQATISATNAYKRRGSGISYPATMSSSTKLQRSPVVANSEAGGFLGGVIIDVGLAVHRE